MKQIEDMFSVKTYKHTHKHTDLIFAVVCKYMSSHHLVKVCGNSLFAQSIFL